MVWAAERKLEQDPEAALLIIQKALEQQPNNPEAQALLVEAEEKVRQARLRKGSSLRRLSRGCSSRLQT